MQSDYIKQKIPQRKTSVRNSCCLFLYRFTEYKQNPTLYGALKFTGKSAILEGLVYIYIIATNEVLWVVYHTLW